VVVLLNDNAQLDPRIILGLVLLVVALSVVVVLFLPIGTGSKVTIYGSATTDSVQFVRYEQTPDIYLLFESSQPGLWFLDSDEVMAEVVMEGGQTASKQIGKFGLWEGSRAFDISLRHIPSGMHSGVINLYKIQGWFSSFGFGDKVLVTTSPMFTITVDDY
jgi:hypothetical protein